MAENELLDMGHKSHWQRTRRALQNPDCPLPDLITTLTSDIEGVCSGLPKALRRGPPLAALLRLTHGFPMQVQAVLAQFTERSVARLANDARMLTRSTEAGTVAACTARLLMDRLIDQIDKRAGRQERFRTRESRALLIAEATRVFRSYEGALKSILECSLRGAPITPFKRRLPTLRHISAKQLMSLSVARHTPMDAFHAP